MKIVRKGLIHGGNILEVDADGYDAKLREVELDWALSKDSERILSAEGEKCFRPSLRMLVRLARIARRDLAYESAACAQVFAPGEIFVDQEYATRIFKNLEVGKQIEPEDVDGRAEHLPVSGKQKASGANKSIFTKRK